MIPLLLHTIIITLIYINNSIIGITPTDSCLTTSEDIKKLLNRVYIVRHGERSPDITFPTYNQPLNNNNPGKLTERGRRQMKRIGQEIAKVVPYASIKTKSRKDCKEWLCYDSVNKSGIEYLLSPNNTLIFTSNVSRCVESTKTIAKELNISETVVNVVSNTLLLSGSVKCNALVQYITHEYLPKQRGFEELVKKNEIFLRFVYEKAGLPSSKSFPIFILSIANTLIADKLINNPMPVWVNESTYEKIQSIATFFYTNLGTGDDVILKYSSGLLMRKLLNDFRKNIQGLKVVGEDCSSKATASSTTTRDLLDEIRKTYVYLGHDHTIIHLLSLLNYTVAHRPGFGSSVILDLWRHKSAPIPAYSPTTISHNYSVHVYYKNYEGGLYKSVIEGVTMDDMEAWLGPKIPKDEADARIFCDKATDLDIEPS